MLTTKFEKTIKEIKNINFSGTPLEVEISLLLVDLLDLIYVPMTYIETIKITVNGIREDLRSLSPIVERSSNRIDHDSFKYYINNIHKRSEVLKRKKLNFDEKQLILANQIKVLYKSSDVENENIKEKISIIDKEILPLKNEKIKLIKEKQDYRNALTFLSRLWSYIIDCLPETTKKIQEVNKKMVEKNSEKSRTNKQMEEFNKKTNNLKDFLLLISHILGRMNLEINQICDICDELQLTDINRFDIEKKNHIENQINLLLVSSDNLLKLHD